MKRVLKSHLLDLVELGLDPVNVVLFFLQDGLDEYFSVVISHLNRQPNRLLYPRMATSSALWSFSCIFGTSAPM